MWVWIGCILIVVGLFTLLGESLEGTRNYTSEGSGCAQVLFWVGVIILLLDIYIS